VTQSNTETSFLYGTTPPRSMVWGREPMYDPFVARHEHPCCASEKGKPVVRRGRKAHGPPSWEVAGQSNSRGGVTKLRPHGGEGADATLRQHSHTRQVLRPSLPGQDEVKGNLSGIWVG
jgi:hypothetical protein